MDINAEQLQTLVAIADHGTFDAAARQLHLTPSAVSQRIRALEESVGRVLVTRATPCRPTESGDILVQLGRQSRLLHDEARRVLTAESSIGLPIAVNADSLATWFRDVLAVVAHWQGVAVHINIEDQAHAQELLRRGEVLAAVTSEPTAVQGCTVERLGSLRYVPVAAPAFLQHYCPGRAIPWRTMPMMVFNDKDTLQHDMLRLHGVGETPPVVHRVPTSAAFHDALRCGLGWGMLPHLQAAPDLAERRLVRFSTRSKLDIALYWQRWRVQSDLLTRLTDAVRSAARAQLRP